jgi:aspartate racemase
MKTIGLIGGMSWESTATYYRLINEEVRRQAGGLHSGKILLFSVDFAEVEAMQTEGRWSEAGMLIGEAALRLEKAGADFLMLCTNTMHKVVDQVAGCITIPLLHIADATGEKIVEDKLKSVGLLGTRFTMEEDFYRGRLEQKYGLRVVVPNGADITIIDTIIFQELCLGITRQDSRKEYQRIVRNLADQDVEAVILGCTEISLLLRPKDTTLVLYDTTAIHSSRGVKEMLSV